MCAGVRIACDTVQRCLLLWAIAHCVLCMGETGERATLLTMVQRLCLGLTESAALKSLKRTRALQAFIKC